MLPVNIISSTVLSLAPRLPAGCISLKSNLSNFLYFIAAMARASPIASCVVVLEVGTKSPDSFTSGTKSFISDALYRIESFLDTIPISKILFLFAY